MVVVLVVWASRFEKMCAWRVDTGVDALVCSTCRRVWLETTTRNGRLDRNEAGVNPHMFYHNLDEESWLVD